jgi:Protein of unknown function (DUF4058)
MSSPFPGMNPYLEHPELWPGVHHWLIISLAGLLGPQLRPKYRVAVEVRVYNIGLEKLNPMIPDVTISTSKKTPDDHNSKGAIATLTKPQIVSLPLLENETIKEGYLEIKEVATNEVITVIEILSHSEKKLVEGRVSYGKKRQRIFQSSTHLVEIDLLRGWQTMPLIEAEINSDYRILVSESYKRPLADLYSFNLSEQIPLFPLPLKSEDEPVIIELQSLIHKVYDEGGFDLAIDYNLPPVPDIKQDDQDWLNNLLKSQQLR